MNPILKSSLVVLLIAAFGCGEDPTDPGPQQPKIPVTEAEFVQEFARAYRSRDLAAFTALFPVAGDPEYLYILDEPDPIDGSITWTCEEELQLHQRMFRPQDTPSGSYPVPPELWLQDMTLSLTAVTEFQERLDLYPPQGDIDPQRWRASQADYEARGFFGMAGETDYVIDVRVNFVVIEDLSLPAGSPRKYLLYRWQDLGQFDKPTSQATSWSSIKAMYL